MTLRIEYAFAPWNRSPPSSRRKEPVEYQPSDRTGAYQFVARTLARLGYYAPDRPSKALVKRILAKTTGYSRAQLTRLIRQHRKTGRVEDRRDGNQGRPFERIYTPADVRLLAQVDADLGQMSGLATRVVLHREYHVFGNARFERLAGISASHIYNLRASRTYRTRRTVVVGTRASTVAVGERRAPQLDGLPGFLRVDTVHAWTLSTLGDRDGAKGRVSGQPRRPSHPVRVRRRRPSDLRALPRAAARGPARPVPVHRRRLPRRQWLGVHQPYRGGSAQQAACARIHQVPAEALHRQRPRRGQERQCRAPVPRPRAHPEALRAAGRRVRSGAPVAISQLPPAVSVRLRARGAPTAVSGASTGPPTCVRPTTSCARCRTPRPI